MAAQSVVDFWQSWQLNAEMRRAGSIDYLTRSEVSETGRDVDQRSLRASSQQMHGCLYICVALERERVEALFVAYL